MSARPATLARIAATVALAVGIAITGAGAAAAHEPATGQNEYVAWLLARAQAASPYSVADDYVDTLVYWHQHQDWGLGS